MSELETAQTDGNSESVETPAVEVQPTAPAEAAAFDFAKWRDGLPEDLRPESSLQNVQSLDNLAKSYVSAQRMIGRPSVPIPDKHATQDDWNTVFHKLGVPEKLDDYKLEVPEGMQPEFAEGFRKLAHESGLLPQQAQKAVDWYNHISKEMYQQTTQQNEQSVQEGIATLQKEFGAAYEDKLGLAQSAVQHIGSEALSNFLDESGAGNNPELIRAFIKVGEILAEDKVIGSPAEGSGRMSPQEAMKAANDIMSNLSHPYHDKLHPNHSAAVKEVQDFYQMAFPSEQA